ncbi:MAG: DUF4469 domain-containing protein [Fimbriimonadaceae bacterium]
MLYYSIKENRLTDPVSYSPYVITAKTVQLDGIVRELALATTLSPIDVRAVVDGLVHRVEEELIRGNAVNIEGLVLLRPSLTGRIDSPYGDLPPDSRVMVKTRTAPQLTRRVRAEARLRRIDVPENGPQIRAVGSINGTLDAVAAGAVLAIIGRRLAFDPARADEGVFLVNQTTGEAVRVANYWWASPSRLLAVVPSGLTGGAEYGVRLAGRASNSEVRRVTDWSGTFTAAGSESR